jgi:hypothetical protein
MPTTVAHNYYLFIDESGDHGLSNIDPDFPVFILCGIITSNENYQNINDKFIELKTKFWNDKRVILHSRDIRKCEKEFQILLDIDIKAQFYEQLNNIITTSDYTIIASAINKINQIKKYGRIISDVYGISLSFVVERAIFFLDAINIENKSLKIIIEKRGKKEDKKLDEHFQKIMSRGTGFVNAERLRAYNLEIIFREKRDNINGLQLADLIAYPIARYIIEPDRANPSFDIFVSKFYTKWGKRYGLKRFP